MRALLIAGVLLSAGLMSGCDTVVQSRQPGRYYDNDRTVYRNHDRRSNYYDDRRNNYYDDRRNDYYNEPRRNRDVTIINREVNVRNIERSRDSGRSRLVNRDVVKKSDSNKKKKKNKNDEDR